MESHYHFVTERNFPLHTVRKVWAGGTQPFLGTAVGTAHTVFLGHQQRKGNSDVTQLVECSPIIHKDLGSIPNTTQTTHSDTHFSSPHLGSGGRKISSRSSLAIW